MFTGLRDFLAPQHDTDPASARFARGLLLLTLMMTFLSVAAVAASEAPGQSIIIVILGLLCLAELAALMLSARGNSSPATTIIPLGLGAAVTAIAVSGDSLHDIGITAYPLILIIGILLRGERSLMTTVPITGLAILLLGIMDTAGFARSRLAPATPIDDVLFGIALLTLTGGALHVLMNRIRAALAKAAAKEEEQAEANRELTGARLALERRLEEQRIALAKSGAELEAAQEQIRRRTEQFEALAQVSREIALVRDLQELLPRIAGVISARFGFYHVGVFLLDEAGEYAVLSATNSEGGKRMMERRHRLRVGEEGIVGRVTLIGEPRVALDVGADPMFFDNPELPNTHSEIALPLRVENRIVGALDVQSTESRAFSDDDIQVLSLLADQVSLAIENARLFDETRSALAEAEAVSRQFIRDAWARVPVEHKLLGYRYDITGAVPLEEPVELSGAGKGRDQKESNQAAVPIELRGEVFGTLVVQLPSTEKLTRDQLSLIRAVAERVALSAENARLFEETTRRAERERLVSDITGKIRSGNDPQAMIQTAVEELRKALGASRVEVIPQTVKGAE